MSTSSPGIEFRNVTKRYGSNASGAPAVDDISFEVPRGRLTTLLGPSGCGKTTTLRLIAGLESPTTGQIWLDGQDVTALGAAQRNVSLVFQSYALFPHMNVVDNVMFGLRMTGVAPASARERALQTLQSVGLAGLDARLPSELSGGQQQRVALARALVLEPAVLLFDEPLSNLDARLRRDMREEIRALQQRLNLTVVYVTHDQGEALAVSDHIVVMDGGRIAQEGTPHELYESPASAFVAGFMGEARLFPAQVDPFGQVALGPLRFAARHPVAAGEVRVAVRPEAWRLGDAGSGLAGRLVKSAYLGSGYELTFETDLGSVFVMAQGLPRPPQLGMEVGLSLTQAGVCVLRDR